MSITLQQAIDEIYEVFDTAWAATGLLAIYQNSPGAKPSGSDANSNPSGYAQVSVDITDSFQATLSDDAALKRWRTVGVVVASVNVPSATGSGWASLVQTAITAFRGVRTTGGVIFRNVSPRVVGVQGSYFQINVAASFEFDEIA